MTRDEASEILELSPHASPAERSVQYDTLRRQLEDKLAKAPTPGLREKYRTNLKQLEEAFAVLSQTDDSASLPVTQKQGAGSKEQGAGGPASLRAGSESDSGLRSQVSGFPPAKRTKSGGKEFLLVAFIAVAVLAAGGWFVMKTRAENAEKARVAAELAQKVAAEKAEAERKAEEARIAAEAKRQADEEEKARLAAAAKAEQQRLEKLTAQVRVGLSEANLLWEQAERAENVVERDLSDLKGTARGARDFPPGERRELELRIEAQTDYHRWLADQLITNQARRAKVRAEEMLNTRQPESAAEALTQYQQALAEFLEQINQRKPSEDALFGSLAISSEPAGVTWELTDSFGRKSAGKTPATVARVGIGQVTVVFRRPDWNNETVVSQVTARKEAKTGFVYRPGALSVTSQPAGAAVFLQGVPMGKSPLTLSDLPVREVALELRLHDHKPSIEKIVLRPGETTKLDLKLTSLTDQEVLAEFTTRWKGTWAGTYVSSWLPNTQFSCKIEPGTNYYLETTTSGKYAGTSSQLSLTVASRTPLRVNRVFNIGNKPYVFGYFLEEAGALAFYAQSLDGKKVTRVELRRTSN